MSIISSLFPSLAFQTFYLVSSTPTDSILISSALKMVVQTGLDYMRSRTVIDCDTMDEESEPPYNRSMSMNRKLTVHSCQNSGTFPGLHFQPSMNHHILE
jgi:hypothetical protein